MRGELGGGGDFGIFVLCYAVIYPYVVLIFEDSMYMSNSVLDAPIKPMRAGHFPRAQQPNCHYRHGLEPRLF